MGEPIQILSGIYADSIADFVESYPINREPVVLETGLSKGYLRISPGITQLGTGPGADRGGINWNGVLYRVMGTSLVSVSSAGLVANLGDVGGLGLCRLDYSFVNLIINSGTNLFYWNADEGLRQVTDPDLGIVIDTIWIDGYTMTTDGTSLVVTELNDPMAVDPLKYGSSEVDPDPITGLMSVRGEVYALNRNTIEVFNNIGGNGFPFSRNDGAEIPFGCVGPRAKALYVQSFAFVGSPRGEQIGVYLAGAGDAEKLSTPQIDALLGALTEAEQAALSVETRVDKDEQRLLINLPDKTLIFYSAASKASGKRIWTIAASGVDFDQPYLGQNGVLAYNKFIVGDPDGRIGFIDGTVETHFGAIAGWQFDTALLFNENGRAIINAVELTGLPGRAPIGSNPVVFMSMTIDGVLWTQERAVQTGRAGDKVRRIQWRPKFRFSQWLGMRFRGADAGTAAFARLDAAIEALGG